MTDCGKKVSLEQKKLVSDNRVSERSQPHFLTTINYCALPYFVVF